MKHLNAARKFFARFVTGRNEGATLGEYGLLLALLAVACTAAMSRFTTSLSALCQSLSASL